MFKKLVLVSCLVMVMGAIDLSWGDCDPYLLSDIDEDCYVNFKDFARLAEHWLETCDIPSDCEWVDIYTPGGDGIININDLDKLADQWLQCTDSTNPACEPLPPYIAEANLYEPPNAIESPANPLSNINLATGEYRETVVDLRIPGRGLDFVWSRTYRSRTGTNTNTGNNWDYSYNIYIEPAGRDFVVHNGSGRRDLYRHQADGTWVADGFFSVLSRNPDLSFALTLADKEIFTFNHFDGSGKQGKIKQITDRNGNSLSFDYNGSGKLETVHDTLDREIYVSYNGNGVVASITDFTGRSVSYQYYDVNVSGGSFGDLKSVTTPAVTGTPTGNDFPDGKTTTYTYSRGFGDERLNHNLLTIKDPNGETILQNVYSVALSSIDPNFDHVVLSIPGPNNDPGNEDIYDVTYVPQTPDAGNNYAVVKAVTNDGMGNVASHFFDNKNRLVMVRQYTGRADPNLPTYLDPCTNPPVNPLRPDDPAYFETRYAYNGDSLLTRIDYPAGNYIVNVYGTDPQVRSRGNLREKHRYAGVLAPISDQNEISEYFEYDSDFGGGCCGFNFVTRYVDPNGNITLHDYDPNGNRIRTTRVRAGDPNVIDEWEYNAYGQTTAHVLPDNGSGNHRRDGFTYYSNPADANYGHLKEAIVDACNLALTTTYEYDQFSNVRRIIDANGSDTQYICNQLNQVVRETSAEVTYGSGVRYQKDTYYDKNNNVVRVDAQNKDDQGNIGTNAYFTTTYEYGILHELVRMTAEVNETHSIVTEYEYDRNHKLTLTRSGEATNGNQPTNTVQTLYDERNLVYRVTHAQGDPNQSTAQYDYDENGNKTKVHEGIEGTPSETKFEYDGFNRLIATADPMGNVTTNEYDARGSRIHTCTEGQLVDVTGDANNVRLYESNYEYDALNRLVKTEVAFFDPNTQADINDGKVTTQYQYSDNSQVIKVTDDRGSQTQTSYDSASRKGIVIDAKGNTATYSYDKNSNVTTVIELEKSDSGGTEETFFTTSQYDNLNRLTRITDNNGNSTEYAYDSRGNRTSTVNAKDKETRYEYDGRNRLLKTILDMDGDGADANDNNDIITTQTWDDSSRLTSQSDDKGNATKYSYDPLNRLIKSAYADGTSKSASYDVHNNPIQTSDAAGNIVSYTYDKLNRPVAKGITPGAGVSGDTTFENYKYDGLSRLVYTEDNDSVVSFSYDSVSNITKETLNGKTTVSSYDGMGNKISCTYPGGRSINYTYEALNRIYSIADANSSIAGYLYIGPGRVYVRNYFNNTRTTYTYDNVRRVTRTRNARFVPPLTVIDDHNYMWDATYNKTQRKDNRAGGPLLTHSYTYDSIDRLVNTAITNPVPVRTTGYSLDGVGNRTTVTGLPDPGFYTMSNTTPEPADEQVNQYTATSFDSRIYDKNGNLNTIDNGLPTQKGITYDYRNQMVRVADSNTGQIHTYSYDPLGRRIKKVVDDNGLPSAPATRYFYDGFRVIEEEDGSGFTQATYVYGNYIDEVLNMQRGANKYYYHSDDMFNVMAITSSAGTVVERYEYDDYGRPVDPNTLMPIVGSPSAIGNPYFFTGRNYDAETGLYYYRTRYLDPRAGRFTTRDTIGIWGDKFNLGNGYTYVGNNPIGRTDPLGLTWSAFWRCWAARDFEGDDYSFTGGCAGLIDAKSTLISIQPSGQGCGDGPACPKTTVCQSGVCVPSGSPGSTVPQLVATSAQRAVSTAPGGGGVFPTGFDGRTARLAPSGGVYSVAPLACKVGGGCKKDTDCSKGEWCSGGMCVPRGSPGPTFPVPQEPFQFSIGMGKSLCQLDPFLPGCPCASYNPPPSCFGFPDQVFFFSHDPYAQDKTYVYMPPPKPLK